MTNPMPTPNIPDEVVEAAVLTEPTEEILTRICEAHWVYASGKREPGLIFDDIHRHDACNHTLSGRIEHDGIEYGFIIQNGNNAGTVVEEWGLAEDVGVYQPEYREPLTFVPENRSLSVSKPAMFKVYGLWRKEQWFIDMVNDYNYDRHFAPGSKTENHYREKAAKRGLRFGLLSNFTDDELAMIGEKRPNPSID